MLPGIDMPQDSLDVIFIVVNAIVFPAWMLLVFAPRSAVTQRAVHAAFIPLVLGAIYTSGLIIGIATDAMADGASFLSIAGVMALFDTRLIALNGWIHYLAFDLFVGAWIARDAVRRGITRALLIPSLLFTFIFGPLGLVIYLGARKASGKAGWSLAETA